MGLFGRAYRKCDDCGREVQLSWFGRHIRICDECRKWRDETVIVKFVDGPPRRLKPVGRSKFEPNEIGGTFWLFDVPGYKVQAYLGSNGTTYEATWANGPPTPEAREWLESQRSTVALAALQAEQGAK